VGGGQPRKHSGLCQITVNIAYYRLITPINGFFTEKKIVYFFMERRRKVADRRGACPAGMARGYARPTVWLIGRQKQAGWTGKLNQKTRLDWRGNFAILMANVKEHITSRLGSRRRKRRRWRLLN
jgi:hypothetical protein